ncbi:MAG: hypothetical protein QNJ32_29445 [Xenococcaceae cyanobacterium MO_167.B27]|nr:hypothetical protein [Xenococcaceae cyanobacterium MO_167.B27]
MKIEKTTQKQHQLVPPYCGLIDENRKNNTKSSMLRQQHLVFLTNVKLNAAPTALKLLFFDYFDIKITSLRCLCF